MTRHDQIYKQRLYEGEHVFACGLCGDTYVQYSFGAEPNEFYDKQLPPPPVWLAGHTWSGRAGRASLTSRRD